MRLVFLFLNGAVQTVFLPVTLSLAAGLILGAWFIGTELRPPRTIDSGGELDSAEWLGQPRGEWLGA